MTITKQQFIVINEGLGTIFTKIGEFFSGGKPKDSKLNALWNSCYNDLIRCRRLFPPLKDTKITIPSIQTNKITTPNITYKDYEENPKYTLCILEAKFEYCEAVIKYLNSKPPEEICKKNINKETCINWIENELIELEEDLRDAKKELEVLKKHGSSDTKKTTLSFNRLIDSKNIEVNSKLISEKVDYYIDMLILNECECNMQNEEENIDECEECDKNINEELEDVDEQAAVLAAKYFSRLKQLKALGQMGGEEAKDITKRLNQLKG